MYRDERLIVMVDKRRKSDTITKKLFKLFKELGSSTEVEMNLKVVQ